MGLIHRWVVAALLVPSLAAATPEQTLAEVQASYAKVQQLQGKFTQTFLNATFGQTTNKKGSLYLVRPDKMRWDYSQTNNKGPSIIFDSKTLWVVEPENTQVYEHKTIDPTLPAAIAFLNGGAKLATDFTVTSPKVDTLVLVPKQTNAGLKQLTFVIDPKTKRVVKSIVINHNDDVNTFVFRLVEKPVDAKILTFSPNRTPHFKIIHVE